MYVLLNKFYGCGWLGQISVNNRDNKISTINRSEAIKYFCLLTWMQLQALNWLNIAQMNLFSRRKITVAVVIDACRVDGCQV